MPINVMLHYGFVWIATKAVRPVEPSLFLQRQAYEIVSLLNISGIVRLCTGISLHVPSLYAIHAATIQCDSFPPILPFFINGYLET